MLHFVMSEVDSVAYGVNFLTIAELDVSVAAYKREKADNVPPMYRFPNFDALIILIIEEIYLARFRPGGQPEWEMAGVLRNGFHAIRDTYAFAVAELVKKVRVRQLFDNYAK
jgi:hypothetical protein